MQRINFGPAWPIIEEDVMRSSTPLYSTTHKTPVGTLMLIASDLGLRAIHWPRAKSSRSAPVAAAHRSHDHPILRRTVKQLDEYFAGRRTRFDIPLDLVGTRFQLAAWHALADIPFGETTSYGQQALALGVPGSARAVGAANGANPVCIVLPCHRVIGANGSLTGFGGGLERKRWLLDHEARLAGSLAIAARDRDRVISTIDSWPSRHPAQRRLSMPVG
jgi:methylated-DNA-[protein]-cysteine S-methyltransferase